MRAYRTAAVTKAVKSNEVRAAAALPLHGNDDPDLYNLREGSVVITVVRCIGDAFSLCLLSDVVETGCGWAPPAVWMPLCH
jgi:hypothetical protein